MKKVAIYLGHPAHYHLFKNIIKKLEAKEYTVYLLIRKKDVLENLLKNEKQQYFNILPEGRKDSKLGIVIGVLKKDIRLLRFCLKYKPDLLIGTSVEISHIGTLLNIPSINVNEDDAQAVPLYAKLAYPLASVIVSPNVCDNGKWEYKSVKYNGYHELAYLSPKYFTPDEKKLEKYNIKRPFFIMRFSGLGAHHDKGIQGINDQLAANLIKILKPKGQIYITSERKLSPHFEKYRLPINPIDMHDVMYYADMYIGDSQTMTAEAAVLGVPALRFNDFVGRLGYLEELEQKYDLTYGIKTNNPEQLVKITEKLLQIPNIKKQWAQKREKMLRDKIDVTEFFYNFIDEYDKQS